MNSEVEMDEVNDQDEQLQQHSSSSETQPDIYSNKNDGTDESF